MLSASPPPAPAAALIGRATEVEDVLDLLGRARLVTLTGPPGVGKTRLALAVCADRDDVSWVDLAPIRDPLQVRAELARAARPEGDDHATDRLVVLDNCEHLLDSDLAGQLADLLRSSARLQVLATSRERLRLATEREYAVPPLPMPSADDADDLARLRGNPAVALLLDRAPPAVQLTPNTARALAEICVDLDGLPLAIELAAARLRVFTPSELAFRLGRRMSVLTSGPRDAPDRHRDLRAAIAWSHDLLSDRDSAAFRRLSVFPGEWDLESAARGVRRARRPRRGRVAAGQEPGPPGRGGPRRRRPVHDADEPARVRRRAARRSRPRSRPPGTATPRGSPVAPGSGRRRSAPPPRPTPGRSWPPSAPTWMPPCQHARAADDSEQIVWLAAALAWFGYTRGVLAEAEVPLGELVAAADDERADPEARAAGRLAAGVTAYGLGRRDVAEALLGPFRDAEGAPEERRSAVARAFLGHLARARGDLAEATALYTAARTTHERLGNARGTAWAGHDLALLALDEDRIDEAERLLTESLELFDSIDYDWAVAVCACLLRQGGRTPRRAPRTSIGRPRSSPAPCGCTTRSASGAASPSRLEGMAEVAAARGAPATAARLVGAAAAARRERAAALATEAEVRQLADLDQRLDRMLGRSAAQRERHAGRTMSPAAAVALALGWPPIGPDDAGGDVVVADPAAAGGGDPRRRRPHEPADRHRARHQREDHRGPRAQHHGAARRAQPRGRGRVGRRARARPHPSAP